MCFQFGFFIDAVQYSDGFSQLGLQPGLTLPGSTGLALEEEEEEETTSERENTISTVTVGNVECCLQECPEFLHYELMQLFPGVSLAPGELRILTLCERTVNNMTGWSQLIEDEREGLLEHVSYQFTKHYCLCSELSLSLPPLSLS